MENILNKIKLSQCTGCGLCEFVCPKKCISVAENSQGFFKVSINADQCVNCGICSTVCHNTKTIEPKEFKLYGGRAKDIDTVENSRSGGLFYLLSKKIIKEGGVAVGAAFVDGFEVKHIAVDNVEDLWKFQGSKYVQSDFKDVFRIVKEANKIGRKVIVGATGCQIAALKSFIDYLKLDKSKIVLVDIVCHGTPSRTIFRHYLNQYSKYGILAFDFRDKSFGWESHKESCYTKLKGRIVSTEYTNAFYSHLILSDNCFNCRYKNTSRVGDISLADFWGLKQQYPDLYDKKGNSLFFINTNDGLDAFNLMKDEFNYFEVNQKEDYWLQPPLIGNWDKPNNYDKFWKDYEKHSYKYLKKKYFVKKPNLFERCINFAKRCLRKIKRMIIK